MINLAYAGSFDPFTVGHLHIIEKALGMFPDATIHVLIADNKNKRHHFDANMRLGMAIKATQHIRGRISINIIPDNMFAVNWAAIIGCTAMIRGIRSEPDFQDEVGVYHANKLINAKMETFYIMPDMNLASVRSSAAMSLIGYNDWLYAVEKLVPRPVLLQICKGYCFDKAMITSFSGNLDQYDVYPYHNWRHIAHCIMERIRLYPSNTDSHIINQGFILHDVVNPDLREDLKDYIINGSSCYNNGMLWQVINSTNHEDTQHIPYYDFVHDIDLSILASTPERYNDYKKAIFDEYVNYRQVSRERFMEGRKEFLNKMLARGRIFLTEHYKDAIAKENMRNELAEGTWQYN